MLGRLTFRIKISKFNDGYDCFRQLIQGLRDEGFEKAAGRLDFLLHRVAWTTGSELLGELGLAIRDFERTKPAMTSSLRATLKECKDAVRGAWPGVR